MVVRAGEGEDGLVAGDDVVPGTDDGRDADRDFPAAFSDLYGGAYRVAFRILGSREAAEDIAQDALVRALVHWPSIVGYGDAWVARVAANLALGSLRRDGRRLRTGSDAATSDPTSSERMDLQRALAKLPRRQREVVVLRYIADRPEAEVAALLGCSPGAVKQHASRGLAALRLTAADRP